jgi:inhibitor of the pro-sigma K processing machinery
MNTSIWLWVLLSSSIGLIGVLIYRRAWQLLWTGLAQFVIGGVLLYFINLMEPYTNLFLPINIYTLLTISILGLPGFVALIGLKIMLF